MIAIMLLVLAIAMFAARMPAGPDIFPVFMTGPVTVGIGLMAVSQARAGKIDGKPPPPKRQAGGRAGAAQPSSSA